MSDSIKKTVYFVRHGQSEHNISPVFQAPDSPLSGKGRGQAQKIAERVSKLEFEVVLASPLPRAKETAEAIVGETGKEIEFSELFVERIKPSSINGQLYTNIEANEVWRKWEESLYTPGMKIEDGENFDELVERADKVLKFLEDREEESIVVVTHGYILRTILARVLLRDSLTGEAFKNFQHLESVENTSLTVIRLSDSFFEKEPHWRLQIYNDHAHLGE